MKLRSILMAAVFLTAFAAWAGVSDKAPAWRTLHGKSIHKALADTEFSDDVHYTYRFHADGRVEGTEMARYVRGHWHVSADEMCWSFDEPPAEEECYGVEQHDHELRMVRAGQEIMSGTLTAPKASIGQ